MINRAAKCLKEGIWPFVVKTGFVYKCVYEYKFLLEHISQKRYNYVIRDICIFNMQHHNGGGKERMMKRLVKLILVVTVTAFVYTANAMIQAWYEAVYNLNVGTRFRHTLRTSMDYSPNASCCIPYISYGLWNYKAYPWSSVGMPISPSVVHIKQSGHHLALMVNKSAR